jgi:tryptophan synthase alpha subunit
VRALGVEAEWGLIKAIKAVTDKPVNVGFGVSEPGRQR